MSNFIINPYRYVSDTSNGLLTNLSYYRGLDSDATDEQGTNDGTASNVVWDTVEKKLGTASADFSNSNAEIAFTNFSYSTTRSFNFRMKRSGNSAVEYIWSHRDSAARPLTQIVLLSDGTIQSNADIDGSNNLKCVGSTSVDDDTWTMITVVKSDSSTIDIWVDSTQETTTDTFVGTVGTVSPDTAPDMGRRNDDGGSPYAGNLDGFGFWDNRVLTQDNIDDLFNSGAGLPYNNFTT